MKKIKITIYALVFTLSGGLFTSCDNFFDAKTDDMLLDNNHYSQRADLEAAFIGTAALFQEVAEKTVLIEGLRSDLMIPTAKATTDIVEIATYTATTGNKLADPTVYYNVIVGCNDFLRRAVGFDQANPGLMVKSTMEGMIAEVVRYRAWCYMTLGKIYGQAIYHDYGMSDNQDVSQAPKLSLEQLISQLIKMLNTDFMGYNINRQLDWENLTNSQDETWNRVSINHKILLGELYLWNKENKKAVDVFSSFLAEGDDTKRYTVTAFTNNNYNLWGAFFTEIVSTEQISVVPFDMIRGQQNNLQYYFANNVNSCYYIRPSDYIINLYDQQIRSGNAKGDIYRGRKSCREENGQPVIYKYHNNKAFYERDANVSIYRAADVHLMFAEALNNLGLYTEALAIINGGLKSYWSSEGSFNYPFNNPIFHKNLRDNIGIRGRVNLLSLTISASNDEEKMGQIATLIANEVAMECAFEGKRFFTLVRMARQLNNPSIVADAIAHKYGESEAEHFRSLMLNPENWFIPFNHLQ
ncbi:MAG: RagB/SusD family nutrient uptake outer membrane protein [Marinifilaceae bacterium]